MKKVTLILLILTITLTAGWWRTYGGEDPEYGSHVLQTKDGGYIFTGRSYTYGGIWVVRTDEKGDSLWAKILGSGSGVCIQSTKDGGYIIIDGSMNLLKVDPFGNLQWEKSYGWGDGGYVQQTADGGYILVGSTTSGPTLSNILLIKTDSSGDSLWSRMFYKDWGDPDETTNFANYVEETTDGGYVVMCESGYCYELAGEWYYSGGPWLIKTDSLGDSLWTRMYRGECASSGQLTEDGGYIITGYDWYENLLLIKTDENGDTVWSCTWGEEGKDWGRCVRQTKDGGFIVTGTTNYIEHYGDWDTYLGDLCLLKADSLGNIEWTRRYGGDQTDHGRCVQETNDGGYIVIGDTWKLGDYEHDIYLLKTDSLGFLAVAEPVTHEIQPTFEVVTGLGVQVQLVSYSEDCQMLNVFDASGRLVDEVVLDGRVTVSWGNGHSPGVYFVKVMGERAAAHKVVLVR
ncbi:hypothetical protein JXM67_08345 [candidate division WOR-3 bacterium]|nr:hypothetical protein [candidate division WOR-3 bacterium]